MDSLTQIVLGAAVGEVVLGKKIGNRAMVWGAVGGTIPDLDVLGKFFLSNIDNLAFHRGISHSITFSVLGALVLGWAVHETYKSPYHKWIASIFKGLAAILVGFSLNFVLERLIPGNYIPILFLSVGLALFWYYNIKKNYFKEKWEAPEATVRDWQWLFFWSLFTHPLLDCFTMYGTQLFAPFSDMRISWATISVVDPLYTLPFLFCLMMASRFSRTLSKRKLWNYAGIVISSAYLFFTVLNKQHVNKILSDSMERQNIRVERFISNPYILNNILWNCVAETKDHFYLGQYSLFDQGEIHFTRLEKNHQLLSNLNTDPTLKTLRWFSDNYFNVVERSNKFQFNDLRFGTFKGSGSNPDDFIFKFLLTDLGQKGYYMEEAIGGPPKGTQQNMFSDLWNRILGKT